MEFNQLDLGSIYSQAGQINAMRDASTFNRLRTKAAEHELAMAPEVDAQARAAEGRSVATETRTATEFGQEQQIANTKLLNAAAAEMQVDPKAAARWVPQLKQAGVLPQSFDPSTMPPEQIQAAAKSLFESTSAALTALQRSGTSGNVQSTRVGENGNIWQVMRDGTMRDTGVKAQGGAVQFREIQLPDGRVVQGTQDPNTGAIYGMQGEMIVPPVRGGGPAAPQPSASVPVGMGTSRAPEDAAREKAFAEADAADLINAPKRLTAANDLIQQIEGNLLPVFDSVKENAGAWTTGLLGAVAPPGSPARDLQNNVNTLLANTAFDRLQEMRTASPTGGALGAVTERELDLLAATRAALERSQSPGQFQENLGRLKQHYVRILEITKQSKQVDQLKTQQLQLQRRPASAERDQRLNGVQQRISTIEDAWWDSAETENKEPSQIQSDEQYNSLPSGAQYIAPDGSTRTKR